MFGSIIVSALAIVSTLAAAVPAPVLEERALPSGTVTCGSHKFSVSQVSAAVAQGYKYQKAGTTVGSNAYPHRYYDYPDEDIDLYCSGSTWYEFPILSGGALYTGGSPGADRVIFNSGGVYCAVVTHTGAASTNGFVSCQGD